MTSFPKRSMRAVQNDPIMVVEQRPSAITGHSWWLVLSYSTAEFEEMLPFEFPSLSETDQALVIAPIAERLRLKMKEVFDKEDAETCPHCGKGKLGPVDDYLQCTSCDSTYLSDGTVEHQVCYAEEALRDETPDVEDEAQEPVSEQDP